MVLHPEVVKRAQEEIDSVTEGSRLPDFSDRESLVYVSAIVKEVQRWQVVLPFGAPYVLIWASILMLKKACHTC